MVVPFISREDIRAALDSLIHSTHKPSSNGLQRLLLVDLALAAPDMPDSDAARDYAVRELLVNEVVSALNEQRALFNLSVVALRASVTHAQAEIISAVKSGARGLVIWSALYYRYVRSDLDLSVDELAKWLAVHPRTFPRYLDDALDLLTQRVIKAEHEARRAQLQRYLLAALPYSVPLRLIGRRELLDVTEKYLTALSPRHLLITGAAGVGKTVFAQELLRRQITAEALDHVIWLDLPPSANFVRQEVAARLLRENSQVTLRDYFLMYRVAIVLDGIDALATEPESFGSLLRDMAAAQVFMVNRTAVAQETIEAHITVPELDFAAAGQLINDVLRRDSGRVGDETVRAIYEHVGGTPLALRLAAYLWEQGHEWSTFQSEIEEQLLERFYSAFDEPIRRAWLALALMPEHAAMDTLVDLFGVPERALHILSQHGLVIEDENVRDAHAKTYALIGAAREFIRRRREAGEIAASLLNRLGVEARLLDAIEYALASGFPPIALKQRIIWLKAHWKEGLRRGHWALWRRILEAATQNFDSAELKTAYGVCLRRLGEWERAEQVFYAVVSACGRDGHFDEQARALLEWSMLARYQGNYQRAEGFLAQAKRYAERARDDELLWAVSLQQAQIAVDAGNGAEALRLLVGLPETAHSLALSGEAHLALGNYETCRMQAERSQRIHGADLPTQASLLGLIGRSYQAQGNLAQARVYTGETISLLERLNDVFALARAQTNLAGILIPLGQLADAGLLLASAEQIQKRLGDRVGLSATRHNRAILGGYIAR